MLWGAFQIFALREETPLLPYKNHLAPPLQKPRRS